MRILRGPESVTGLIKGRDYQLAAVDALYKYFGQKSGNPVIALPTGTGKSVVIAIFLDSIYRQWPTQRVMIVTHVKELIQQNFEKLKMYWPFAPAGIYSAGLNKREHLLPITFAGIQSVANKWALFGHQDLVIIDEAHLVGPGDKTNYQKFLAGLRSINPNLKVIGLTATPYRLGHGAIADGELFDDVCFNLTDVESFNWLIAKGYLSPLIPRDPKTLLDIRGVGKTAGEFNGAQLQAAVDKQEVTYAALKEALELAADRRHWLIFASGVDHSIHIAEMLESFGEKCLPVHSKMSAKDRDDALRAFMRGEVRMLSNNNILTTGYDSPWIDCIVCLRPTASSVLWVQMLGRGTRPFEGNEIDPIPKKNCLALDFANNTRRLGPINDPVVPRRKGEGGGEAPVKKCEICDTWNHASVRICCNCGAEFKFEVKIKQEASPIELVRGELPKVNIYKVDHITAREHVKAGKPPMVRMTYYCNLKAFTEYVGFEHGGFFRGRAERWWKARTDLPVPATTAEALAQIGDLPAATHLRVWVNKEYPEILATCFDGTAFNTQAPTDDIPEVQVDKISSYATMTPEQRKQQDALDDDIPF